jgi:hypothetical protein
LIVLGNLGLGGGIKTISKMQNPYTSPQALPDEQPYPRPRWRLIAFVVTAGLVLAPALFFALMLNTPTPGHIVFAKFLGGPFTWFFIDEPFQPAHKRFTSDLVGAAVFTLLLAAFTAYPRWYTFIVTLFGAFCWFGAGLVAATGGV